MFSSSLFVIAGGARLLGSPGPAMAASAAVADDSAVAVVEQDSAATAVGLPAAEEEAAPEYVVGRDEVGVLFGDGPIGIKLGENPLKASGICRVFVTEVKDRD